MATEKVAISGTWLSWVLIVQSTLIAFLLVVLIYKLSPKTPTDVFKELHIIRSEIQEIRTDHKTLFLNPTLDNANDDVGKRDDENEGQ